MVSAGKKVLATIVFWAASIQKSKKRNNEAE